LGFKGLTLYNFIHSIFTQCSPSPTSSDYITLATFIKYSNTLYDTDAIP